MKDKIKSDRIIQFILFLFSSVMGVLLSSYATSPLYASYLGTDSPIFLTIGKAWAEGKCIPYLDLFDHKGPIIFFIDCIGWKLTNSTLGVVLLQIIFVLFDEFISYRILILGYSKFKAMLLSALLPVILYNNYDGGNMTEEYILPLLFLSFYLIIKWLEEFNSNTSELEHSPFYAFVYGITFAFALMTRVTNCLGVCVAVLFIVIFLIYNKSWKNLAKNALAFIVGVFFIVLPFCIYFGYHNALYDMWFATLLYNFEYTADSGMSSNFIVKSVQCFLGLTLICVCIYKLIFAEKKQRKIFLFWLMVSSSHVLFNCNIGCYTHYGMCFLPFFYVAIYLLSYNDKFNENPKVIWNNLWVLFTCIAIALSVKQMYDAHEMGIKIGSDKNANSYQELLVEIPNEDKDSFIAFNCPTSIYLDNDLTPSFKFFILQSWQSSHSDKLKSAVYNEFKESKTKWVLINKYIPFENFIQDDYVQINNETFDGYKLYKLKE